MSSATDKTYKKEDENAEQAEGETRERRPKKDYSEAKDGQSYG